MKKVLVIVGPTSSGKTSLAIWIAKKFSGEIISADSRQIYKDLDIGTGKVTPEEQDGVPHHFLDTTPVNTSFSASQFSKEATTLIQRISKRGNIPILVGGTGFYIDAAIGLVLPSVPPNEKLRKKLESKPAEELFEILVSKDPKRANTIDRHNKVRLIRAIEIVEALGKVPSLTRKSIYNTLKIGLSVPKEQLEEKIKARLKTRLNQGLVNEVKKLKERGTTSERLQQLGLEYRIIDDYLTGKIPKKDFENKLLTVNIQYAKRQRTWFKKDKEIIWVTPTNKKKIERLIKKFLS